VPVRDGYWDGYAYEIDPHFADLAADIAHHRSGYNELNRKGAADDHNP
jgi:hypothetical protein